MKDAVHEDRKDPGFLLSRTYAAHDKKTIVNTDCMTILYVDDDPEDLEIFHDAVRTVDPSIKYISAKSAQEALKFLRAADTLPDYLVLDINMPGMDGKLCLRKIREDPKLRNINAVVYSTNSFPRDIEEIQSLDATFIKKANSFNDLSKIIRDLVGK